MEAVFSKVLDLSLTASYVIAALLLIRLLLKKAPKKYSYALWLVAAFRLVCPVSIESAFSLFNLKFDLGKTVGVTLRDVPEHSISDYIPPAQHVTVTPPTVTPDIVPSPTPGFVDNIPVVPSAPTEPETTITLMGILAIIWCVGIAALFVYSVVTYIKLKRQMSTAVLLEDNIRQASGIRSPFILGFIRPQIYIPYHLSEAELSYVLAHERYHLKRRDHIIKPLAFLILAAHWFNPLVWLAFHLMVKDMEMSCDEKVLSRDESIRKNYSSTLLSFAAGRAFPAPSPLSFGEGSVKSRIKNILSWKKPALWLTVAAIIICIAVVAICGTNPRVRLSLSEVESVYANGEAVSANAKAELITLINDHSKTTYRKYPENVGFADSRAIINCADGSSYWVHYWYCSGFSFNPAHYGEDDYYTILSRLDAEGNVEKSWKMEYDFDKEFLSWLKANSAENIYPFDSEFILSEAIFTRDNGVTLPIETAETIRLESGRVLYADDELLGTFEQWSLTEDNWDNYLTGASGTWQAYSAKELRRNNFRAWRSINGDTLHYLLLQEDGSLYIAGGYYDSEGERDPASDDSNIFCIYELTNSGSIRWRYVPYEHPDYFPLEFDFDYDSVRFIATSGSVRYLDANGTLCYNMDLEVTAHDMAIGWCPTPAIDMSVIAKKEVIWGRGDTDPELYFTATLKSGEKLSGTIVFSNPKENDLDLYEAALTSDSLSIKRNPNGGAIICASSSVVPEVQPNSAVWAYRPELSSRAPWFEFEFDMEYESLQISATSGSLSSDGSIVDGNQLVIPAGYTIRWSPLGRFQPSSYADLQFELTLTDGGMVQGTIYISSEDNRLYTATLLANGLSMSTDEDYGHAVITSDGSMSGAFYPPAQPDETAPFTTDLDELLNKWHSEGVITLSEEHLAQLNRNFIPDIIGEGNRLSSFFQCYYERPEEINLAAFLQYNYVSQTDYNEEDFNALKQQYPTRGQLFASETYEDAKRYDNPIHKFPREKVDDQLMRYAGITTADLTAEIDWENSGLVYLAESDAYFNFTSDMAAGAFTATSGHLDGDTVYLRSRFTTLTLRKSGYHWLIYSHTYDTEAATRATIAGGVLEIFDIGGEMDINLHTATSGAHETITVTDRAVAENISYILLEHQYTELEMPLTEPSEYWISITPTMPTNKMTIWSGNTQMLQYSPHGRHSYYSVSTEGVGSLAWAVRRVYENLLLDYERIDGFAAGTAEAATELFTGTVYGEHLMDIPTGGIYSIEHYRLIEQEVIEVSDDGSAVLGRFVLAVWPDDYQSSGFWAGNGTMGTGDYYGWILSTYEFVLKLGEDGLWHCTGLGTGGYSLD